MQITKSAVEQFKKMLKDDGGKDSGIRIFISGGGCCGTTFGLDVSEKGEKGDKTITENGVKIFVSPDADEKLSEATIDHSGSSIEGFKIRGLSSSCCG
ncbi:MAG: hypothetical protein A2551_06345 [Elusimicrobia bacterium RIFOXYD2_FULL_34_30]|nr:MAG: hypothetical protein A2551_06345 [Elusimicrobia bacterium RIFOXYD2_FULL_34_30]